MPRYKRYQFAKLEIEAAGERPASWTFTRAPISGTEFVYRVIDRNFENRNEWEFLVRVPKAGNDRIEVRPRTTPNLRAWAGLERRSLTFTKARRAGYRGQYYCQIALADPTGQRTKDVIRGDERDSLPPWFDQIRSRLRMKDTVRGTRGNDGNQLIALVDPDDHRRMIGLFFATKVWVLRERVNLAAG